MTAPPPRRPWWKKRRTWATGAAWLLILYPTSAGPVAWASTRGLIPGSLNHLLVNFYAPLRAVTMEGGSGRRPGFGWYWAYVDFFTSQPIPPPPTTTTQPEYVPDPAVNRTHWTPPPADDGVNRTKWAPPKPAEPKP